MSRCTECETIEGDWKWVIDEGGHDVEKCCECGGIGCQQNIPEHDWNEER